MSIVYVTEQGSSVKRISRRLLVEKEGETLLEIPVCKTEGLVIFGNIQVSSQALSLLSESGIPVTFLSFAGHIKGQYLPAVSSNLDLKYLQYRVFDHPEYSVKFAAAMVQAKIRSIEEFYRQNRAKNEFLSMPEITGELARYRQSLTEAKTYNEILGYEGSVSKLHFQYYGKLFKKGFEFTVRSKRPPLDEVNAMLGYGYALLFNYINGFVHSSGLDIYLGCLHLQEYGRCSLSLDVMEGYRARIVDRFVLNLCNTGIMNKGDFGPGGGEGGGIWMNEAGKKKFLSKWDELIKDDELMLQNSIRGTVANLIKSIRAYAELLKKPEAA